MNTTIIQQQVKGALENKLFTTISGLNTGVNNSVLRAIISRVAETEARAIVDTVFKTGNQTINTIPSQLIGPYNPVNLVSGNLGSTGVYNNINPVLETQLTSQLTNSLVTRLMTELRGVLPANTRIINFEAVAASLVQSFTPSITSVIGTSTRAFTDTLFGKNTTVAPVGGTPNSITGIFKKFLTGGTGTFNPANLFKSLTQIDLNFSNNIANTTLNQVRNFKIDNQANKDKIEATKKGFNDPSATYPKKEYQNQSETNKLARAGGDPSDIAGTVVTKKNDERMRGAVLPFGNAFSEPPSAFKGEYPFNKVTETESGHIVEIDDTPGCERLHVYHKSGTYIEIDSNGTMVRRTRGSSYEIIDVNGKISIRGRADISVTGECNIYVGNDANFEVTGNVNLLCHNDITAQAGGKLDLSATEEINIHSANVNIEADNIMHILADNRLHTMSGNATHMTANTSMFVYTGNAFHASAEEELLLLSQENLSIVTANNLKLQSSENTDILAAGDVSIDGDNAYINSGNATGANTASKAVVADTSNIGLLSGRKYVDKIDLEDPQPLRYDALLNENEGYEPTKDELKEQHNRKVTRGVATRAQLEDKNPVVISESSPRSTQGNIILPDQKLLSATNLPGNFNLSPNYTIDNMWKTVAVCPGKHKLQAQAGLTYGQIVYNLQALCLNVLEPVRALYPKVIVTSAFRSVELNEPPKSAHGAGLAVDLQFPGVSKSGYYEIAVKLAQVLIYDQLLLEYWAQANNPWVHVGIGKPGAFNPSSLRKVAWTFNDHKLFKQTLVNLA